MQGKTGLCGFTSTNLPFILQHNGIKNVALAGYLVRSANSRFMFYRGCQYSFKAQPSLCLLACSLHVCYKIQGNGGGATGPVF